VCDTAEEVIDYLTAKGEKVGLVKVHLYRPFSVKHLMAVMPKTVKAIAVLDRTKEPGAIGEPLYLDMVTAFAGTGVKIVGGRYGLASKDTTPGCVIAALRNIQSANPVNGFTVGIDDDVTNLSLPITEEPDTTPSDIISCKFWGLGSDGTVGANKNSIKIIGDHTDMNVQAYFQYDSKKSGGITISHLRFGNSPIKSTYYISKASFVACHNSSYLEKYDMVQDVKPGGAFLINCAYDADALGKVLPADAKQYIAKNNIQVYTCDAVKIARELGLGNKMNAILQAAFFKLSNILPIDDATQYMKEAVRTTYGRKGEQIVNMNINAIDAGLANVTKIDVPADWANAVDETSHSCGEQAKDERGNYIKNILEPVNAMRGDKLSVSAFTSIDGGSYLPAGTSCVEKRGIAVDVPCLLPENCIQCNQCSMVCPHAVIRPFALDEQELAKAPESMKSVKMLGKGNEDKKFAVVVSALDCTGCGSCANVCPAKNKALVMKPLAEMMDEQKAFDYAVKEVSDKQTGFAETSVKGSQFKQPLMEFSGACAGCGETPYAKLVTQLFGDRMYIANATGCSSIWGGSAPATPYTVNKKGQGPAWSNSLFEDNAEFGLGMEYAAKARRQRLADNVQALIDVAWTDADLKAAGKQWLDSRNDAEGSKAAAAKLVEELEASVMPDCQCDACVLGRKVLAEKDMLVKPSFWIFGGDGWAYDIGYGGLDHVLASGENVNVLVFDTEVYSNTGGQASKATPTGAVAQFAAAGKSVKKKDLAKIAMSYGYVYVAQIAMGANYKQTIDAIVEAEKYDGPSLIIAYAPCINHGIRAGMGKSMEEAKKAVACGYWNLIRFNPDKAESGENPLSVDSKEATDSYSDFILGEVRYSSLKLSFPERAQELFAKAEDNAKARYKDLVEQKNMYDNAK
jgi:pyruvate-ferredoxin/flavodoxin oxidoreductase